MVKKQSRHTATGSATRLLREPAIHFFIIGALIFCAHRLIVGDPRTIDMRPVLRTDLQRRFRDQMGRPPSSAEVDAFVQNWKLDEALYREALLQGLDRDDPAVRALLISKMRERAALESPVREPSQADLDQWFTQHRDLYESPLIYEHEYVTFPKNSGGAEQQRAKYERALKAGATPATLGLRSVAANVNRERIEQELGPELANQICSLPIGEWRPLENQNLLLLVRMIHIQGGPPSPEVLHQQLVAGWKAEMQRQATERALLTIEARYRFEERAK